MTKKKVEILIHNTINPKLQQGHIISVSYGYARNYLIPKQYGSLATQELSKKSYRNSKIQKQRNQEEYNSISTLRNVITTIKKISIKRKIEKDYRFFGSITTNHVIQVVFETIGILIDKKQLELTSIRKIGIYIITIQLSPNLKTNLQIQILPVYTDKKNI